MTKYSNNSLVLLACSRRGRRRERMGGDPRGAAACGAPQMWLRAMLSYKLGVSMNSIALPSGSRQKSAARPDLDIVYVTPTLSSAAFNGARS